MVRVGVYVFMNFDIVMVEECRSVILSTDVGSIIQCNLLMEYITYVQGLYYFDVVL